MKTIEELGIETTNWRVNNREYGDPCEVIADYRSDEVEPNELRTRVVCRTNYHFDDAKATANLISAAQELYKVCRNLIVALKNHLTSEPTINELELLYAAESALVKAGGKNEAA